MATTLTSSTLKVTIKEEITLNSQKYDTNHEILIPDINKVRKQIVRFVGPSIKTLLNFYAGQYNPVRDHGHEHIKFIRITNLDNESSVSIELDDSSFHNKCILELGPLQTFLFYNNKVEAKTDNQPFVAFNLADMIRVSSTSAVTVDLEVFVAESQPR